MSRYKKAPLPSNLKSIPKGIVYLGKGQAFKLIETGWSGYLLEPGNHWSMAFIRECWGGDCDSYYFAPADSEIARLNGIKPRIRKKKPVPVPVPVAPPAPVTIQDVWDAFKEYTKQYERNLHRLILWNDGVGRIETYSKITVFSFVSFEEALAKIKSATKSKITLEDAIRV